VVADSSRSAARGYGVLGGQATLAVPSMHAKILAQREGLGVGWLPRQRIQTFLKEGDLVERSVADPREPNTLYVAWRGESEGRALAWWLEQLKQPRLAKRLIRGLDLKA
ncbi:MAG TPA: LysR substrate-binding domain-containing protein, partial [Frateuria sp.]|uniref:LysR substrate-binding domain-containing protein n=1 Tax=Frateuria sp. TaxID=2211372 RepID=UPI002D7E4496